MNVNVLGLAAAAVGIVTFQLTYHQLRPRQLSVRWGFLGVFALLSVPSILFAIYYFHILPEQSWFYTLRSWRGSEFLVVFPGCAAGAAAALLPRLLLIMPLFAFTALAVIPYMKPMLGPIPDNVFVDNWQGDTCLQSTASTCGPASVCTILKRLGVNSSERIVARAGFSSASGTEAWYLARYVRSKGFVPRFVFGKTFSPEAGLPALVGVRLGNVGHFIAVLDVSGDQVTFADPMWGEQHLSISQFQKRYRFTGFHMVIARN